MAPVKPLVPSRGRRPGRESWRIHRLTALAFLASLSLLLILTIRFPILPTAPFLEYEPGDVPLVLAALIYGPWSGLVVTFAVSTLQTLTVSSASGPVGFLMHMAASGTLVMLAAAVSRRIDGTRGLALGLSLGSVAMTALMVPLNLVFTVHFLGVPRSVVVGMLWSAIIPFNLIRATANSVLALLVFQGLHARFGRSAGRESPHERSDIP